jgi:outer membrane receptor protein involved in Fe transport
VQLESLKRVTSALLAVATCTFAQCSYAASAPLFGLSIEDAIAVLERDGLRVFYSTDLVRPWMRVQTEPQSQDPAAALDEILEPLGLTTQSGPNGTVLIIRDRTGRADGSAGTSVERVRARTQALPPMPVREEIVVSASQYELRRAIAASMQLLSGRDLENLPDIGDDALRAVSRLPGTATNGISGLANVRGGEISETLVRLDGLRLYDPFHLKDFQSIFSMIDPRIVSSIDVYTGGFPATFGDRMSGVIDVETMPAPESLYHEIGLTFFNSSFLSSGHYDDGRGEWIASVRRSNLDILYDQFSDQPERPRYTDAFAKIAHRVGDRLEITANVLRSEDDISLSDDIDGEERAQADHRDLYVWMNLEHTFGTRTSGRTLVAHSQLDSRRLGTSAKAGVSTGALTDVRSFDVKTLESDWTRHLGDDLLLLVGGSASRLDGRYDYADQVDFDLLFGIDGAATEPSRSRAITIAPNGSQYALFATLRYDWTERLTAELGARWDKQTLDVDHSDTLGPRIGMRYALSGRTALRASWGRFYQSQAINELQVSDGVDGYRAPQRSDHAVLGLEHTFVNDVGLRVEVYEKSMGNLRPRFENLLNSLILLPELKPDRIGIAPTTAQARGLEVMIEGAAPSPLEWWAAYGWSQVRDRVGTENILRSWDQTHAVSAGGNWDTTKWNLSAGLIYRSGWPTTGVSLDASGAIPVAVAGERNDERLGFYRSIDLRLTRKIELERSSLAISLEIANLFGRSNPCCIEYEIGDEEDQGLLMLEERNYLPTIPSIGLLWKF